MTVKELIEELKKYDQDMKVSYPYFEEEDEYKNYIYIRCCRSGGFMCKGSLA